MTTTTAPLFQSIYPYLTQSTTGLCFIAYGVGGAVGSVVTGKVLDYDWRKMEARYAQLESEPSQPEEGKSSQLEKGAHTTTPKAEDEAKTPRAKPDRQDLPIEHTRLKRVPVIFTTVIAASLGYGWSVEARAHLAVPLVMQFIGSFVSLQLRSLAYNSLIDSLRSWASEYGDNGCQPNDSRGHVSSSRILYHSIGKLSSMKLA